MTQSINDLIEERRLELEELRASRAQAQDAAAEDQVTLAQITELEQLEKEIKHEKEAAIRATALRTVLSKRVEAIVGKAQANANEGSAE